MGEAIRLRGGNFTRDPRLDRIPRFDERSRMFAARDLVDATAAKKPRGHTWKLTTRLDQGSEGRCTEYAICHELLAVPKPVEKPQVDKILAGKLIYWPAQREDEWAGGSYPGADPFYEGTSVLSAVKVAARLGWYGEYRWAFGLEDLILAVGYLGPAILGTNWYSDMMDVDPLGFVRVSGKLAGGHAWVISSVNVKGEFFGGEQSWGPKWGVKNAAGLGGAFRISFADTDRLLREDGEGCIPGMRRLTPA